MKKQMAFAAALVVSASTLTAAHAATDVFQQNNPQQTDTQQLIRAQNETNVLLTRILSEVATLNANQGTQGAQGTSTDCFNGEQRFSQGYTVTTQDGTKLRCDIKNGHPTWVSNAFFAN